MKHTTPTTLNFLVSRVIALLILLTMTVLLPAAEARAAWGDFDTSFGFQGAAVDPITGYVPRSTAIQPDGKILVTGYRTTRYGRKGFFLRQYLSDGQLDTAFGTNGAALGPETDNRGSDYRGDKIVVKANGRIAVAGWANGYYAVWQFNSNGTRDSIFGSNGLASLTNYPVTSNSYPELNIQNGKLLLSIRKLEDDDYFIVLVRLTSKGLLDNTFGNAGECPTGIFAGMGTGTVVEADGKITVSGVKLGDLSTRVLERRLPDGDDDPTFSPAPIYSVGLIYGGLVKLNNAKYAMRRGNLDINGTVTFTLDKISSIGVYESRVSPYTGFPIAGCPEIFTNQSDGKLIVQGAGMLFRLNAELTGPIESNDCSNLNGITNFARGSLQPDDKMVVAGVYNNNLIFVRLLPN